MILFEIISKDFFLEEKVKFLWNAAIYWFDPYV